MVSKWPSTNPPVVNANLRDGTGTPITAQNPGDNITVFANSGQVTNFPELYVGNSRYDRQRVPNIFRTITVAAAGDTALWTPAAGKKFRLMGYQMMVTAEAIAAAAAHLEILLCDAAVALGIGASVFVPLAAIAGGGDVYVGPAVQLGNGPLSALANNVLNVNLSFALTGGEVRVNAWGIEE